MKRKLIVADVTGPENKSKLMKVINGTDHTAKAQTDHVAVANNDDNEDKNDTKDGKDIAIDTTCSTTMPTTSIKRKKFNYVEIMTLIKVRTNDVNGHLIIKTNANGLIQEQMGYQGVVLSLSRWYMLITEKGLCIPKHCRLCNSCGITNCIQHNFVRNSLLTSALDMTQEERDYVVLTITEQSREATPEEMTANTTSLSKPCRLHPTNDKNYQCGKICRSRPALLYECTYNQLIPPNEVACHICNVKRCIEISHIFSGTAAESLQHKKFEDNDEAPAKPERVAAPASEIRIEEYKQTFLSRITKVHGNIHNQQCWIINQRSFTVNKVSMFAYRASHVLFNGPIKKGQLVIHCCKTKLCVNPEHVSIGTIRKNNGPDKIRDGTSLRGSKHHNAILTEEKVLQLVADVRAHKETRREIAKRLGVSYSCIRNIMSGNKWAHTTKIVKKSKNKSNDGDDANNADDNDDESNEDVSKDQGNKIRENTSIRGSKNPHAKLTEDQVLHIVADVRAKNATQTEIAKRFRVSPSTISQIMTGRKWSATSGIISKSKTTPKSKADNEDDDDTTVDNVEEEDNGDNVEEDEHDDNVEDVKLPKTKLTEENVLQIVADVRAKKEPRAAIARRFGVSSTCVSSIMTGRNWCAATGIIHNPKCKPKTTADTENNDDDNDDNDPTANDAKDDDNDENDDNDEINNEIEQS